MAEDVMAEDGAKSLVAGHRVALKIRFGLAP
jgi:hypothetical protein